jgi:hypothetical protein
MYFKAEVEAAEMTMMNYEQYVMTEVQSTENDSANYGFELQEKLALSKTSLEASDKEIARCKLIIIEKDQALEAADEQQKTLQKSFNDLDTRCKQLEHTSQSHIAQLTKETPSVGNALNSARSDGLSSSLISTTHRRNTTSAGAGSNSSKRVHSQHWESPHSPTLRCPSAAEYDPSFHASSSFQQTPDQRQTFGNSWPESGHQQHQQHQHQQHQHQQQHQHKQRQQQLPRNSR